MGKRYLKLERKFDSAHHLEGYDGACACLHGHTWKAVATWEFSKTNEIGIAADFKLLKSAMDKILPDHKLLNDWLKEVEFEGNPTAENLSVVIFDLLRAEVVAPCLYLTRVEVWESDSASAAYEEVLE